MANAVVTVCIGPFFERLAEMTHPLMAAYAARIGAEFVVIDRLAKGRRYPHFEKFRMRQMLEEEHERIVYVDTDALVRNDCPDLFKLVAEDSVGAFRESDHASRHGVLAGDAAHYGMAVPITPSTPYYNTGVMVLSRCHAGALVPPEREESRAYWEQTYLNLLFLKNGLRMHDLPCAFNWMRGLARKSRWSWRCHTPLKAPKSSAYVLHHACGQKRGVLAGLARDLAAWRDRGLA